MPDFQTVFDPVSQTCDWAINALGELATGNDLYTATTLSLFSDARALASDDIPIGSDPRGCVIDIGGNYQLGSRLWLLRGAPTTDDNLKLAKNYCTEALAWLLGDGVVAAIAIDTEYTFPRVLGIGVTYTMPDGTTQSFNYSWAWAELN